MSILKVNEIRSQTGTTITIPSGHTLSLGGTAITSNSVPPSISGNAGKFLSYDGSTVAWRSLGPASIVTFTSSGTWTKPAGITKILVRLVGGGGAGSGVGESGGAGGYSEKIIDVAAISSVSVTIGNGSTSPTYYSGPAGAGTTTSFGSYLSASGGYGANQSYQHCGGLPGVGSGGDINLFGGGGCGHAYWSGPVASASFFGGAAASGHPQGGNYAHNHSAYAAYGAGGVAGYHTSNLGANGKGGVVVVWEFR